MDNTYILLQHYWWFLVSLLGALLVFLVFVQGGQSLLFSIGKTELEQKMLLNSTGRKWEFTFTTLVTFGGAFFASFPLFYSTSFGGAYWVWMLILLCFVIQAVSYEYQAKKGSRIFCQQRTDDRYSHAGYFYLEQFTARTGSCFRFLERMSRTGGILPGTRTGSALFHQQHRQ